MSPLQIFATTVVTTVVTLAGLALGAWLLLGTHSAHANPGQLLLAGHGGGGMSGGHSCELADSGYLAAAEVFVQRRLDLDATQEAAWQQVIVEVRAGIKGFEPICRNLHATADNNRLVPAPERLAMAEGGVRQALVLVERVQPVFASFYASLSAAQQEQLDAVMNHRGKGRHRWHG